MSEAVAVQMDWTVSARESSEWSGYRAALMAACIALIGLFFVLELSMGTVPIPMTEVVKACLGMETSTEAWKEIVVVLRMPRALTAIVAGAALATGGLILQTLFRNPLAGPWVLGITAGAKFGVSLVLAVEAALFSSITLGKLGVLADLSIAAGSCLGSVLVLALITLVARRVDAVTLLIVGLMFQYLAPSLGGILAHLTPQEFRESYKMWLFAEFGNVGWPQLAVLSGSVAACLVIAFLLRKPLNVLLLGERYALTLGQNVNRVRMLALASMVGLAGMVTAFCGPVGFLDLAVPHLCRGIFRTSDHRILVPGTILFGALLGLVADFIVHLPWQRHVFHLDYVTALIGAPVMLWILLSRRAGTLQ